MMKYIKLDDAIQAARPEGLNENRDDKELAVYAKGWNACIHTYVDNLCELSAADVRPVVRGHWERTLWFVTCSVCEYTSADTDDEGSNISLNFCPNCGADMRGES